MRSHRSLWASHRWLRQLTGELCEGIPVEQVQLLLEALSQPLPLVADAKGPQLPLLVRPS